MNPALKHYLNDGWKLVRTTPRFYHLRNTGKPHQLRGNGSMTVRIVRSWYEPVYLWARNRWYERKMSFKLARLLLAENWGK